MTANITYDYVKANTVQSGYMSDPDATLKTKTGICFDYAALTAAMLENAAFAFRNGAPRIFLFVGSLAVILSFAAAAELQSLAWLLFFVGFAFVELAFLSGASLRAAE